MIRTFFAASALILAGVAMPAMAQDAAQTPPPGPAANTPPPASGNELFGGELTPGATAAIVGVGIAIIAIASDSSDGTTTTTTTTTR
ncbi:hypothetical protein KUV51_11245 [Tateyamaria omphalii]|uniref:hypothetical protein n=1 Tax=Tateyamaria omphalii TaxID=299262 RepID=UPI001C990338|nr:hypothetical protein [Tateyamaria omphalii]MBY5933575.1 hypothetical protein [Tateyamaria omphalii]